MNIFKCDCTKTCGGYAPLVLRVATGVIFAAHGYQKLMMMGVPGVAGFFGQLGFPMPMVLAWVVTLVELVGGVFLISGFMTHLSAKLLAVTMLVATVWVHLQNGIFVQNGGFEFSFLLFAASVSLMITGPGKLSVDGEMSSPASSVN